MAKRKAGEREVARIFRDELGLEIHRNWQQQAAQGGVDLIGVPGWGIEIKRAKESRINEWWTQTAEQAEQAEQAARDKVRPVLFYRLDRQSWMAMMSLLDLRPDIKDPHQVTMFLLSWCTLVREEMNADVREFQTAQL